MLVHHRLHASLGITARPDQILARVIDFVLDELRVCPCEIELIDNRRAIGGRDGCRVGRQPRELALIGGQLALGSLEPGRDGQHLRRECRRMDGEAAHCIREGEIHLLVAHSKRVLGQRALLRSRRQSDELLGENQGAFVHGGQRIAGGSRESRLRTTGFTRCPIDAERHGGQQGQQGDDDGGMFR
jgi:hypothetical protein